jgi:geranylgeranyl reductase family protein
VIGAGPAGSAAAFVLAGSGMSVVVLDAAVFPRDKLCGGLLSRRAENTYNAIFATPWDGVIDSTSHGALFFDRDRLIQSVEHHQPIYFTSRMVFDAHLLSLAAKAGAAIREGRRALSVGLDSSTVRLAGGECVKADFIVGCDGVMSRVAESINLPPLHRSGLAAGLEMHIPRAAFARQPEKPEIYFRRVQWGYGWLFPKRGCLTVGLAGLVTKNSNLKAHFIDFVKELNQGRLPPAGWKGHAIPFGAYRRRPGQNNVVLAGDAAGLVEPVTGEGIAFAMQSGSCAAKAILAAATLGRPASALSLYLPEYSRITKPFYYARIMRRLVFPAPTQPIFLRALERSRTVATRYLDLLAGEIDYSTYARFLVAVLIRRLLV